MCMNVVIYIATVSTDARKLFTLVITVLSDCVINISNAHFPIVLN